MYEENEVLEICVRGKIRTCTCICIFLLHTHTMDTHNIHKRTNTHIHTDR